MLTWIRENPMLALTIWGGVNAGIISPISAKLPPTTWYGKVLHVLGALSPVDAAKAIKAIGQTMVLP